MYELIIIGSGPAGLSAAVYAARYMVKTLVIGELRGGLASEAYEVCNFLTYKKIRGFELSMKMAEHVQELGVEIKQEKVESVEKKEGFFEIKTNSNLYSTKKIILAIGTKRRKLGLDREFEFAGKGVSYCATCDAAFFKDKVTAVVGGSDSALTAALLLSKFSKKVYIIYRQKKFFRAEPSWIKNVEETENIFPVFESNVVELIGEKNLSAVKLDSGKILELDGLFVDIGADPNTEIAKMLGVELENGYIKVNSEQKTNIEGVFAAGDVCNNFLKQIITAASEGAVAAKSVFEELRK
jgi:thioredoxin reductase (NADPH)